MRTARTNPTRQVAHGALLSLALLTSVASAAAFGAQTVPMTKVGLSKAALQTLTTLASDDVPIGGVISDTATLVGTEGPGSLSFSLYGPDDDTCTTLVTTLGPVAAPGDGSFPSGDFTPTTAGLYRWVAEYTDQNGRTITSDCEDTAEHVVVNQATPTLRTLASDDVSLGGSVFDRARLTGGFQPTGTITFNLYPDVGCEEAPVETSTVPVSGNGPYQSAPFTPTAPGTYHWRADYSGDANNTAAGTACNDPLEDVVVSPLATPTITTQASPDVDLGGTISDTATLTGGNNPTGIITFTLFGPDDAECAGEPVVTDGVVVAGPGPFTSAGVIPTEPGTYQWIAAYSGDANNAETTTACGDAGESVVVRAVPVTPRLVTEASRDTFVGKRVHDTATLSGGADPTGTITFSLYGPGDATCSRTPVFTSTVTINGNGVYPSGTFRPTTPGTYQWIAAYSGDSDNEAVSTTCDDENERVVVRKKAPYGPKPRP
ncbi:hypothetical protein [Catellatospora sichuanensis]|uniref:hypothetical protein n=1 Tax=Catellatospora sichuanensis TaxID=1969805 RepID=UPI001182703E|nr:hypothetical protein [Catellatospora sichuanensis]